MQKQQKFHHSITENGNLQLRIITEYTKNGKIIDRKYSNPMTPADPKNMKDWDKKSQDIISVIIDDKVKADFEAEKQVKTSVGVEEIISYDRVIDDDGKIAVRRITRIFDEGVEVSKKYHRSWIMPGDDSTGNDVISKAVAKKIHTPEVIKDYKAKLAKQAV